MTIQVGMTKRQVRRLIGRPQSRSLRLWLYLNRPQGYRTTVRFVRGRVVAVESQASR